MNRRPPSPIARLTVLLLLCGGSSWGLHALGLTWAWAVPCGAVAGFVVFCVGLSLDHRRREGCHGPRRFPDPDDPRA